MRGRQRDIYTTYKRATSRDHLNASDREEEFGRFQNIVGKETGNPSWKRAAACTGGHSFIIVIWLPPWRHNKYFGGMLLGRLFVGTGMGLGPPVAALYVAEASPTFVRVTYRSFTQIVSCLGLMGAFFIGIPAKDVVGWWRVCFWVSTIPAALLAFLMEFCAESPHMLLFVNG